MSVVGHETDWWQAIQRYLERHNNAGATCPHPGYAAAALSATAFLWALLKLPESLKRGESVSAGESHLKNFGAAFRQAGIGMVLLTIFLTTFAFAQFESTLSLLTRVLGESDKGNFLLFAYVGLVLTLSQGMIIRRLATRVSPENLALGGTAVMIVGLGLIGLAGRNGSVGQLYWFLPIAVIGFSAVSPSLQSLLSLRTPADRQGEVLGTGQSMSALARILGPVAGMRLFDDAHVEWPYWMGAGLMLVGLVLVAQLRGDAGGSSSAGPDSDQSSDAAANDDDDDDAP
jgi:predicted MFS family arabinose efflux permease